MSVKIIVTTSINAPTKALRMFDRIKDWSLIVIGDQKTPANFKLKNGLYVSPRDQEKIDKKLSDLIGWNCIQRRNFGFLLARNLGADIIATVDDDNIPMPHWGKGVDFDKEVVTRDFKTKSICFDPLSVTEHSNLWHRGFPIELLPEKNLNLKESLRHDKFDIKADLWNGDPDVDAVCRIAFRPDCKFSSQTKSFSSHALTPFNSQNTFVSKNVLPHYFMFPHVGRFDDIWAAYYVQSIGFKLRFDKPSVVQVRNKHNLVVDLKNELLGYQSNLAFATQVRKNPEKALKTFLPARSFKAFCRYRKLMVQ